MTVANFVVITDRSRMKALIDAPHQGDVHPQIASINALSTGKITIAATPSPHIVTSRLPNHATHEAPQVTESNAMTREKLLKTTHRMKTIGPTPTTDTQHGTLKHKRHPASSSVGVKKADQGRNHYRTHHKGLNNRAANNPSSRLEGSIFRKATVRNLIAKRTEIVRNLKSHQAREVNNIVSDIIAKKGSQSIINALDRNNKLALSEIINYQTKSELASSPKETKRSNPPL